MDVKELLENYSKEIDLGFIPSVKDLIDSHRRLREMSVGFNKTRGEIIDELREYIRKETLETEFLSRDRLKTMTLQQIANWVGEDD